MPRRCVGQCSIASGTPAAYSPPIPMPKSARKANSMAYEVEKPLSSEKIENQRIDTMSGPFRPHRSAAVPAATPPTRRVIIVTVPRAPASALSTVKLSWMSIRTNMRRVKSNPSRTHPQNAALNAFHCSLLTCRYHGPVAT